MNTDKQKSTNFLNSSYIETRLGKMLAIADQNALYLLDFADSKKLEKKINLLKNKTKLEIVSGKTAPIISIESELKDYFDGKLKTFKTPVILSGSPFQNKVWKELMNIPYGKTQSYLDLATAINNPKAFRAAANANGANKLPIIIPCHRIIYTNGKLGGYSSGIEKKQVLIDLEKKFKA